MIFPQTTNSALSDGSPPSALNKIEIQIDVANSGGPVWVDEVSPLKQGLKLAPQCSKIYRIYFVDEVSPLKQGLKLIMVVIVKSCNFFFDHCFDFYSNKGRYTDLPGGMNYLLT